MKRFVFVAVAGLCSAAPMLAQEGPLAPTSPVVPAPVLQSGGVANPAAGKSGVMKFLAAPKWSPLRSPVSAGSGDATALPPDYTPALPPPRPAVLPGAGVAMPAGSCPDGSCAGHRGSCWQRLKQWACFQYSCSDLPKCQPTPYITPLQGMFPCAPCGCGGNLGARPAPLLPWPPGPPPAQPLPAAVDPNTAPMPQPKPPGGQPLPQPMPLPTGAGAMPPRGTSGGATAPAGFARAKPAPVSVNPNAGRYQATNWNTWNSAPSGVVPASGAQK
jgi:hypothetical protein